MTNNTPPPEAMALLQLIAGASPCVFRTIDDDSERKDKFLTRSALIGPLPKYAKLLASLNERGAGVFFMANEASGKARKDSDITRVRVCFADLDGSPLEPVEKGPLKPHAIVETSPGKFHAYWVVRDFPLSKFEPVQASIAARFGGDPVVKNLSRIMRLPGYVHAKVRKGVASTPFVSRLHFLEAFPAYTLAEILTHLTPDVQPPVSKAVRDHTIEEVIPVGRRNNRLYELAAGFIHRGYTEKQANQRMQVVNATRCEEPLCATEVDAIVRSAAAAPSKGFSIIPHHVTDSPEFAKLDMRAESILHAAYRRYNGSNNGEISLPQTDFPKFGKSNKEFIAMRLSLVKAKLILKTHKPNFNPATGVRTPQLYALAHVHEPSLSVVGTPNPSVTRTHLDRSSGSTSSRPDLPKGPSDDQKAKGATARSVTR